MGSALGRGCGSFRCKWFDLRSNGTVAHQLGQVSVAAGLRIVVRAVVFDVVVSTPFDSRKAFDAHGRGAEEDAGRDQTRGGQVATDLVLPCHFRGIIGSGGPGSTVGNGVTTGED